LARWLIEEEITIYNSVASAFRHFVTTLTGSEEFPHLRLIKLMGETVYRQDVELYQKHFSEHCIFVTRVISHVRGAFQMQIGLRALFESPTVAGLASQIVQQQATTHRAGELAEMLADVESLSDEEAKRLIAQEGSPTN
jgi:uncharacterized protein (DUF305 family)